MKRISFVVALFAALGSKSAQALYCGSALVNEGQRKFEVFQKCGEPAFSDSQIIYVPNPGFVPPHAGGARGYGYYGVAPVIPVVVDEWLYNFGPTKMMPRLVFRDGVLWTIRYHGYGN